MPWQVSNGAIGGPEVPRRKRSIFLRRRRLAFADVMPFDAGLIAGKQMNLDRLKFRLLRQIVFRPILAAGVLFGQLVALGPPLSTSAYAANALERAIEEAAPCKPLKVKQTVLGVKIDLGVDSFESIKIDALDIHVVGDVAQASASGTLSCRTSSNAAVQGGFSAKAQVRVEADLATCAMKDGFVEILETGGEFGDVVAGLKDQISIALRKGIEKSLTKLCTK
jgi:hypothetical protein